jgi:hypothetical protein
VLIDGGKELQRCLYAFAVKTLLKQEVVVDAALFYPRAADDEEAFFPLKDVDAALAELARAIALAKTSLEEGKAPPGIDAKDEFNDLVFALPATASYLPRKAGPAQELLGDAAKIWEAA